MTPKPHRVNPRQPARTGRGNRDQYVRGYSRGLAAGRPVPPPSNGSRGTGAGCAWALLAIAVLIGATIALTQIGD